MSNFRKRASEIKAAGEAERGNFTPRGVPLRIYNYWLNNSMSSKAEAIREGSRQENFCHFWRVVLIWAALTRADKKLGRFILSDFGGLTVVSTVAVGLFVMLWWGLGFVGALGVVGFMLGLLAVVLGLSLALIKWEEKSHDSFVKAMKWLGITAAVLVALATGAIIVIEGGLVGIIALAAGIAGAVAFIFAIPHIADFFEGLEKERAAKIRADIDARFDYFQEHGEFPTEKTREPGRIGKFFSGVSDFFILMAQVVRVNKWKICPIVQVGE